MFTTAVGGLRTRFPVLCVTNCKKVVAFFSNVAAASLENPVVSSATREPIHDIACSNHDNRHRDILGMSNMVRLKP